MSGWSTKKRDDAPRGTFRHASGVWAVRFTCGAGHIHQERVGPLKGAAIRLYHERRARALDEPGWCPRSERARAHAQARGRMTFEQYAGEYTAWAVDNKKSARKERYLVDRLVMELGPRSLQEITTADVERVRDGLLEGRVGATVNRYRDLLSAMFKRAVRLGLVPVNPVTGIPKFRETGRRIAYLPPARPGHAATEEGAVRDALPERLRLAFTVSVHTGLRWSEQAALCWRHIDVLTNLIAVEPSKNGHGRGIPMNSVVRGALVDRASQRARPDDADERVFPGSHRQTAILFSRAVERARGTLRDAGRDPSCLDGYTWHCNRHTFASRLVMAGVDLRTVQELGGWRTLAMVMRYAHLSPLHLHAAVERLVVEPDGVELRRNFNAAESLAGAPVKNPA